MGKRLDPSVAAAVMVAAGVEPLDPYQDYRAAWRCRCLTCGREVRPALASVRRGNAACAFCSGKKLDPAEAVQVMRNAGLEPLEPFPGGHKSWKCTCLVCGRVVTPSFGNVRQGHLGCKYCSGNGVDPSEARATMYAAGLEPLEPYPGDNKSKWLCRCRTCGRQVQPKYNSIHQGQKGCGFCAKNVVDPLEVTKAIEAVGLEPLEPYPGALKKWKCKCKKCGRLVAPKYNSIQQGTGGCAYCGSVAVDPQEAADLMREAGVEPLEPYPGSQEPWRCRCQVCGREPKPRYVNVRITGSACSYCSEKQVDPEEAANLMRQSGLIPKTAYPGTDKPWDCECSKCGRRVTPMYTNVKKGSQGCRWCSSASLFGKPARIYLIAHVELSAVKVGIARRDSNRVANWERRGWQVIGNWLVDDGADASDIEGRVLDAWRSSNLPIVLEPSDVGKLGGHTETAPLWAVDLDATLAQIEQAIAAL